MRINPTRRFRLLIISIISYIVFNYGLANIIAYEAQGKFALYHSLTFIVLNNFATALLLTDIYFYLKHYIFLVRDERDWLKVFFTEALPYFTLSVLAIASCGGLYDLYYNIPTISIWLYISKYKLAYVSIGAFIFYNLHSNKNS